MTTLQNDLLEIYNNLVTFSKTTLQVTHPKPITVWYDKGALGNPLVFSQENINVRLRLPVYYCLGLENLTEHKSYLLPEDYDYLMKSLASMIEDSKVLDDRTCLSPENYGFDIYALDPKQPSKGIERIGGVRFISGNSWLFRTYTKWKYRDR